MGWLEGRGRESKAPRRRKRCLSDPKRSKQYMVIFLEVSSYNVRKVLGLKGSKAMEL